MFEEKPVHNKQINNKPNNTLNEFSLSEPLVNLFREPLRVYLSAEQSNINKICYLENLRYCFKYLDRLLIAMIESIKLADN